MNSMAFIVSYKKEGILSGLKTRERDELVNMRKVVQVKLFWTVEKLIK